VNVGQRHALPKSFQNFSAQEPGNTRVLAERSLTGSNENPKGLRRGANFRGCGKTRFLKSVANGAKKLRARTRQDEPLGHRWTFSIPRKIIKIVANEFFRSLFKQELIPRPKLGLSA
jgi:hypothetical protein